MAETIFAERLRAELDAVPVIDPHCHLTSARPGARTLADVVLYHHIWIELVSAGMPATAASRAGLPHEVADPEMEPLERVRACLPYLHHLRAATSMRLLRWILADLYGMPGGLLREENLEAADEAVRARAADPAWEATLFGERCHIARALTVQGGEKDPGTERIGRGMEGVPLSLLSGKQGPAQVLAGTARSLGTPLRGAAEYGEAMLALGRRRGTLGHHFVGLWLQPSFALSDPTEAQVDGVLRTAREDRPVSDAEDSLFCSFGLRRFLEGLRATPLRTLQVIFGAQVFPPHRSVTQWGPEIVASLARLAGEFEEFRFDLSTAAEASVQDIAILAKHVPNISVAGYWWHVLYPGLIRKSLELRLDAVPANKITAFFSDAYHAEWCYPKLKMVKGVLADILVERVASGWYDEETALSLPRQLFYENPKQVYGVQGVTAMFIDVHVHTRLFAGPERLSGGTYATPEELMAMLKPRGVRKAVILPGVNPECATITQGMGEVLAIVEKYPDFFISFMNIDPRQVGNSPDADLGYLMRYYQERGCKGIGEVCASLPFDHPLMENLFRHAEACRLPLTFHIAPKKGGFYGIVDRLGLPGLDGALRKFPKLIFFGHSQPFWSEISGDLTEEQRNGYPKGKVAEGGALMRLFRTYPNLYGDLSPAAGSGFNAVSRDPEFGCAFLEEFQDRLLFATDICDPRNKLTLIDYLNDAVAQKRISREAYAKIGWRNAERLLGLE